MTAARIIVAFVFLSLLAPAGAQAELIVPDNGARRVFALDDTVVYQRVFGRPGTVSRTRPWMRVVDGRRLRARGVPRGAYGSAIGRDYKGRVVLTMATYRGSGIQWWIYDVRQDRARRLTSLRGPCAADAVSIWRRRVAYTVSSRCARRGALGVFLRTGRRVRHLAGFAPRRDLYGWYLPVLRGGTLLAVSGNGDGDGTLWRMTDRGRVCRAPIPGADTTEISFLGAWIEGRTLLWWLTTTFGGDRDDGGLVGVELGGTCERPGPTGPVPLPERPSHRAIRSSGPVTTPPPNDDFANAEPLPSTVPSSREVTIGRATLEPGEQSPGEGSVWFYGTRSIWFSFRPTASQRLSVEGSNGVFTGSSVGSLQSVGTRDNQGVTITFDAHAGETYSIVVTCPLFPSADYEYTCDLPSNLAIRPG
jgi:hypothetical protein